MRPKTLNQTIIKLISERCFEHFFVGLPPWWAPIVCDLYTGFTLSWGSTKCMLTLRRSLYAYDEVSVGNEDGQYHIIVRLFLNPFMN